MTEKEIILQSLRLGDFKLTNHAHDRMLERSVSPDDIRNVADSVTKVVQQANGKYRITGIDLDGDVLSVVCAYDGETVVITVI